METKQLKRVIDAQQRYIDRLRKAVYAPVEEARDAIMEIVDLELAEEVVAAREAAGLPVDPGFLSMRFGEHTH